MMPAAKLPPTPRHQGRKRAETPPPLRVVPARRGKSRGGEAAAPTTTAATEYPMHYTQCRALGHAWQHLGRPASDTELGFRRPIGVESGSIAFISTCAQCGTKRTKWIGRFGALFPPIYRYPDGYEHHASEGEERVSQLDWRRAWVVNALG